MNITYWQRSRRRRGFQCRKLLEIHSLTQYLFFIYVLAECVMKRCLISSEQTEECNHSKIRKHHPFNKLFFSRQNQRQNVCYTYFIGVELGTVRTLRFVNRPIHSPAEE